MARIETLDTPLRVQIKDKTFSRDHDQQSQILCDVEFTLQKTELVIITGPSGCGKTTLLNLIAGLDRDYQGTISLPPHHQNDLALSYVFQEPRLLPWRTVRENITLAMKKPDQQERVTWLLEKMKLQHAANQYPKTLSLGMCRRVALARAFAPQAPLLLMDEPFSSIDELTAVQLRRLLLSQLELMPRTVLFVTHNLREALTLGDRLLILANQPTTLVSNMSLSIPHKERSADTIEQQYKKVQQQFPDVLG